MWIGVLWAGLRVAMWITHVGGKFRHDLLEKSLNHNSLVGADCKSRGMGATDETGKLFPNMMRLNAVHGNNRNRAEKSLRFQ